MLTRLQISVEKISKAIATSKMQNKMTTEDVDEAFCFISNKLDFLSRIGFMDNSNGTHKNTSDKELRKGILLEHFKNQEFTIKQIVEFINGKSKTPVDERTARRDVAELTKGGEVIKLRHGLYKISDDQMSKCPNV